MEPLTNGHSPQSHSSSHPSSPPRPLQSRAVVALDLEPVARRLEGVDSAIRQSASQQKKDVDEAKAKMDLMTQGICSLEKQSRAEQRCLQVFEEQLSELKGQHLREWLLRPLARKLLQLKRTIASTVESQEGADFLSEQVEAILGDFGIDVMAPTRGDNFDPQTMKPQHTRAVASSSSSWVVEGLTIPGARYGGYVLEYAQVQVRDGIDQVFQAMHEDDASSV